MERAEELRSFELPAGINLDEYNQFLKQHFERESKDFVTFLIQELDLDYQSKILHIGAGAGWLSLELARRLPEAMIVGLEPNPQLAEIAAQNLSQMNFTNLQFLCRDLDDLKIFANRSFDAVISNNHLHTWNSPQDIFNEIERVLVKNGKYAIGDYRRDLKILARLALKYRALTMPKMYRAMWRTSIAGSYTLKEIVQLLMQTKLKDWKIRSSWFDFLIYKI